MLSIDPHPLLALRAFTATFPQPVEGLPSPAWLQALLAHDAEAPLARTEEGRALVRDLLRHGGYKPTGRGKPASEYLVKMATGRGLSTINLPVDACNVVSLHSGLPISVVDLDRTQGDLRVGIVEGDQRYVFNASGQEIRLEGLLCLFDDQGPCANAVKDSQRTKTHPGTTRTLSILWGPRALEAQVDEAFAWYQTLITRAGAATETVAS